jgi:Putative lumazine-binding
MKKTVTLAAAFLAASPVLALAGDAADEAAIKRAALDYAEGWYEGNPERMERALHPELAKRIVRTDSQGRSRLDQMGALTLINGVRAGHGKKTPAAQQMKDVTILDVYGATAGVKVVMSEWIDYLHLARWNGEWRIVNVLWELKPSKS